MSEHIHDVIDTGAPLIIDVATRRIVNPAGGKIILVKRDCRSERLTFELPRFIEEHDMLTCNVVEVHYCNTSADSTQSISDVYTGVDMQNCPDDDTLVQCTWLVGPNATRYAGTLVFSIKFKCVGPDGDLGYQWGTIDYAEAIVADSTDAATAIEEAYPDILARHAARMAALEKHTHTAKDVGAIPEGGDKTAMVDFQRVIAEVLVALTELGIYNSETLHVFLKNVSTDPNTAILQLEGEAEADEPPKPVVIRGVADPINSEDAANLKVLEELEHGVLDELKKYAKTADVYNRDQIDQLLQNLDKYALAENVYDKETIDQKLQNLDKYATTQYVDDTVGAINAILATLSDGGVSGGES